MLKFAPQKPQQIVQSSALLIGQDGDPCRLRLDMGHNGVVDHVEPLWRKRNSLVSALVGVAGSNLMFFSAIPHIGAGFVALIITLPPLPTHVGALALRMERFQMVRATGVAAALAGAGALAARKRTASDADGLWILLALVGPILLAIGNLYRRLPLVLIAIRTLSRRNLCGVDLFFPGPR